MRPKQWIKNLFVLAAPLFSVTQINWMRAFFTVAIFIFVSSAVYILNDILDIERDRCHPQKCNRPLPAGNITVQQAVIEGIVLFTTGLIGAICLSPAILEIVVLYAAINVAYSYSLKYVPVIDVLIVAFGFLLRSLAGAVAVGIPITPWFMACVFGLSLFLSIRKREYDINPRYNQAWIPVASKITRTMVCIEYMVFALQSPALMYLPTVPFAWAGLFRYTGGTAENELIKDNGLLLITLAFGFLVLWVKGV